MADPQTHHLLLYEYVENMVDRRGPYREAHLERIHAQRDAGNVVMAGALGNPPTGGAIAFKGLERAEIEKFVHADPYFEAGLVTSFQIEPWNIV
jgi:uncharacterized protein YciI